MGLTGAIRTETPPQREQEKKWLINYEKTLTDLATAAIKKLLMWFDDDFLSTSGKCNR